MEGDETWALLSRDSRPGGEARRAFGGVLGQRLGLRPATDGPGVGMGRWGGRGGGEDEAGLHQGAVLRPSQIL